MKVKLLWMVVLGFLAVLPLACDNGPGGMGPSYRGGGGNGGNPNPSPTPTSVSTPGAVTIMVSTTTSGLSATGYIYTSSGGTNEAGGMLSLSAHVGDTIQLPGSGLHPLYFDSGTSSCIYMGAMTGQTYVFPSAGTYYFHCGNHGSGCSGGLAACGSTNCSAMAGIVTVN